ncbi:transposase [Mycolicibacterium flavescens]|nr:transposase [Mycolicibacterium flavescens]
MHAGQVDLHFIPPRHPWRNSYVESLNSRIRDECPLGWHRRVRASRGHGSKTPTPDRRGDPTRPRKNASLFTEHWIRQGRGRAPMGMRGSLRSTRSQSPITARSPRPATNQCQGRVRG